ncbi:MAG TPA: hypothetical protein VGN14_05075 [Candidatus Elarobacter sp.]
MILETIDAEMILSEILASSMPGKPGPGGDEPEEPEEEDSDDDSSSS